MVWFGKTTGWDYRESSAGTGCQDADRKDLIPQDSAVVGRQGDQGWAGGLKLMSNNRKEEGQSQRRESWGRGQHCPDFHQLLPELCWDADGKKARNGIFPTKPLHLLLWSKSLDRLLQVNIKQFQNFFQYRKTGIILNYYFDIFYKKRLLKTPAMSPLFP